MDNKTLTELIIEAQQKLDEIAGHCDFVALLESELWDDPAITLSDARQALDDLQKAHNLLVQEAS